MQQLDYFEKILKNIVSDKDLSNLSLKNSGDSFSKLCRAFIIKFYNENKDFNASMSLLNSLKDETCLSFLINFLIHNHKILLLIIIENTKITFGIYFVQRLLSLIINLKK